MGLVSNSECGTAVNQPHDCLQLNAQWLTKGVHYSWCRNVRTSDLYDLNTEPLYDLPDRHTGEKVSDWDLYQALTQGEGSRGSEDPPPLHLTTACHLHIVFTSTNLDFYILECKNWHHIQSNLKKKFWRSMPPDPSRSTLRRWRARPPPPQPINDPPSSQPWVWTCLWSQLNVPLVSYVNELQVGG